MAEISMVIRSWPRKQLEETDPDLLRELVTSFVHMLMRAEADALCGGEARRASTGVTGTGSVS